MARSRRREAGNRWVAVACGIAGLCFGCASAGPRPQTGEISFRLTWSGRADVDLYVDSPLDERVFFLRPTSESGGQLDVDCNYGDNDCPQPMENIFWPRGGAPAGEYRYWALVADHAAVEPADRYRLEVRLGRQVVRVHEGRVSDLDREPESRTIVLAERP